MEKCKNCIHYSVCMHRVNIQTETYAYMGVKYDTEKCKHFKPTADEVVRCKDCAYSREHADIADLYGCSLFRNMQKPDDYCSYGRRKEQV